MSKTRLLIWRLAWNTGFWANKFRAVDTFPIIFPLNTLVYLVLHGFSGKLHFKFPKMDLKLSFCGVDQSAKKVFKGRKTVVAYNIASTIKPVYNQQKRSLFYCEFFATWSFWSVWSPQMNYNINHIYIKRCLPHTWMLTMLHIKIWSYSSGVRRSNFRRSKQKIESFFCKRSKEFKNLAEGQNSHSDQKTDRKIRSFDEIASLCKDWKWK